MFGGARMPQLAQLRFAASVATVQAPSARPSALLPSAHRFAEPRGLKTDSKHSLRTLGPHHPPISHVASFLFVSSPPARRHTHALRLRARLLSCCCLSTTPLTHDSRRMEVTAPRAPAPRPKSAL